MAKEGSQYPGYDNGASESRQPTATEINQKEQAARRLTSLPDPVRRFDHEYQNQCPPPGKARPGDLHYTREEPLLTPAKPASIKKAAISTGVLTHVYGQGQVWCKFTTARPVDWPQGHELMAPDSFDRLMSGKMDPPADLTICTQCMVVWSRMPD